MIDTLPSVFTEMMGHSPNLLFATLEKIARLELAFHEAIVDAAKKAKRAKHRLERLVWKLTNHRSNRTSTKHYPHTKKTFWKYAREKNLIDVEIFLEIIV
ncbi:MAG: hypothetical protein PHW36_00715 [Bacilli bacterium]|nr:hypothetical protein [Bacilli bacterium]